MRLDDFNYKLPKSLIAQKPASPRDGSRLFVINRKTNRFCHKKFRDIGDFLKKGDVIVLNQSKVLPARLFGKKQSTKGKVEILLLNPVDRTNGLWGDEWVIIGQPNISLGQRIVFAGNFLGDIIGDLGYEKIIKFNKKGNVLKRLIFSLGQAPLPPYIRHYRGKKIRNDYQTVYAKIFGSVAAPTAGFHFTKDLMEGLRKKGIVFKYVTLHIGLGTFQPIKTSQVEKHRMHSEWARIDEKTAQFLNKAKQNGQRIIAVGTTATRTMESFAKDGKLQADEKLVDIFIYPIYKFKFIDGLITNFHLPKSTPLLLTCAFSDRATILRAYKEAMNKKYRFYSFGDAMFIY